jgi:hypothetical protein
MSFSGTSIAANECFPLAVSSKKGDVVARQILREFRKITDNLPAEKQELPIELCEDQDTGICLVSDEKLKKPFTLQYEKRDGVYYIQCNPSLLTLHPKQQELVRLRDLYNQVRAMLGKNISEWHTRSAPLPLPKTQRPQKPRPRTRQTQCELAYLFRPYE